MQVLWVALVGFGVALVFSMVGSGGSQILVPILFWLGFNFLHGAIPLALWMGAVICFSAGVLYYRRGLVMLKMAVPFGSAVLVGSVIGALATFPMNSNVMLIFFAVSNIFMGIVVWSGKGMKERTLSRKTEIWLSIILGIGVGFMLGFAGRDGGPFVVAILILLGFEAKEAAATTTLVLASGCLAAFLTHLPHATIGWEPILAGGLACLVGAQIGSRFMTVKLDSRAVRLILAWVMIVIGVILLVQGIISL
jgi:uncharacterized membrane protein YfcA